MFERKSKNTKNSILTIPFILSLVACALVTLVVSLYVVGLAIVYGPSMQPTMKSGDIVVVNKLATKYERNDVIIVELPDQQVIKRIIGIPGDTVQIIDGIVFVNGEKFNDVVTTKTTYAGIAETELTLGNGEYFILGDNRANSKDSRYDSVGPIQEDQIMGRVIFSLMPPRLLSK